MAMPFAKFRYQWWDPKQVAQAGLLELEKHARPLEDLRNEANNLSSLWRTLEEHHINLCKFGVGEAKTLPQLASEVQSGACRLVLNATEHKKMVRLVNVAVLRLYHSTSANPGESLREVRLLIETGQCYPDGRRRTALRLPGTKQEPYENAKQAIFRLLKEAMDFAGDEVVLNLANIVRIEEETKSPSYPGVQTVYRKNIVDGVVRTQNATLLSKLGLPDFTSWCITDKSGITRHLTWMPMGMAIKRGEKLGAKAVSTLVRPPGGLNEAQLTKRLEELGLDGSKYGQEGKTISIKELSAQLIRCEATLAPGANGQAMRVAGML